MGRKQYKLIYKVTNTKNGMCYIGQTKTTLAQRKTSHKRKALVYEIDRPFYNDIRKFGFEAFEWEIVCYCDTLEELYQKEIEYINSIEPSKCYNLNGGGVENFTVSEYTRKKLSNQKMGENNPMYGRKMPKEEINRLLAQSMKVCSKKVAKIDKEGNIIETYPSISECARQNGISIGSVSLHVNKKLRTQKFIFV